jgi:ketosteroid isomerase-like protein
MSKENIDLVETIYEAFGSRNFEALLSHFVNDFEWIAAESSPLADRSPYHGIDAVREGVFYRIAMGFEKLTIDVDEIFEADGRVVVLGYYSGRFRGKAEDFRAQVAHIWTVQDGKATKFQQYVDTLQIAYSRNNTYPVKESFATALFSEKPSPDLNDVDPLYDWLIGSWDFTAFDYFPDGSKLKTEGEWIFSRVLEGRAILDIFMLPKRSLRTAGTSKTANRYGIALRAYHEKLKTWKVYWHNPLSGAFNELTASRVGADIVQSGTDANGNLIRWVFTEHKQDSFLWRGEQSLDEGNTWQLNAEFLAVRKK